MTPLQKEALLMFKSVAMRFLKGGLAGAAASVAVVSIHAPTTWTELSSIMVMLSYAALTGFIAGGVLAVEKYMNWVPSTPAA